MNKYIKTLNSSSITDDQPDLITSYADEYTSESVIMMGDILSRPESWFGIPESSRNIKLSQLQMNLDEVAKSLVTYSNAAEHRYDNQGLIVQIRRNYSTSAVADDFNNFGTSGGDTIIVSLPEIQETSVSVAFVAFTNFGCIVDGRFDW